MRPVTIQVNCKYCSYCRHNARKPQITDISPEFRIRRMSKDMSERMSKDMCEDMSEGMSKDMSERMAEDMLERMSKDM